MVTPLPGYQVDPNNPNGVVPISSTSVGPLPTSTTLAQDQAKANNQGKSGYDILGNPIQIAKPITTFSSDTATNTYIPKNQQTIQQGITNSQTAGSAIDPSTGAVRYTNGQYAQAPSYATQTTDESGNSYWVADGKTYLSGPDSGITDPGQQAVDDLYKSLQEKFDTNSLAGIQYIKDQYDSLVKKQEQINAGAEAQLGQSLVIGGSSRYAMQSSIGLTTSLMSQGLQSIADLRTKEQGLLVQANDAMIQGDMKFADQKLQEYQDTQKQRQAVAQNLADTMQKQSATLQEKLVQSSRDSAIANLLSQGVTDPKQILNYLNFDENGNSTGNFTADEVKKTLDNLSSGMGGIDKLTGNVKNFQILKTIPGGLPSSITSLPEDKQMGAFLQLLNNSSQTPTQQLSSQLGVVQKQLAIQRTGQLIESAKALEAARIVGSQITHDAGVQNFLKIEPMMDRLNASQSDIEANGINQSNAADLLDAITQVNTGGKVITEGQVNLTKESQSYADQAAVLMQKIKGQGGVISPKIAADAIELSKKIFGLYKNEYQKRISVYNNRLSNVNGQDLSAYSPLTDITNLPAVINGSYTQALQGDVQNSSGAIDALNAQSLLDNPPADATTYDPSMWGENQ